MGRMSKTYVEGWNPGFWDGIDENGNRVGGMGWFEPEPPPTFPVQDDRRNHRVKERITIKQVALAAAVPPSVISGWERGREELTQEQIDAYDKAIGYKENDNVDG